MALSDLTPAQRTLLAAEIPGFSAAEMARRRTALEAVMSDAGVDAVLLYGANRAGSAIQWITGWPVTAEGACLIVPGERDVLWVEYFNHIPLATRIAAQADVRSAVPSLMDCVVDEIKQRKLATGRLGIIGPLGFAGYQKLDEAFGSVASLGKAYVDLRLIKSAEEIDWLTIGAALSDEAIGAMRTQLKPGLCERELADLVEHAYVPHGGTTHIHYFGISSMKNPSQYVPQQYSTNRQISAGDVVFCEISAAFWGYAGQVLRSFVVEAEPTQLYKDLYATAEAAYQDITAMLRDGVSPQEVVAASGVIERNGFTTCDDLVHGYGGGYFPPILGSASRPAGPLPDINFKAGMTVVVQPNVISPEHNAGVQLGDLLLVEQEDVRPLHKAPREFFQT